MLADAPGLTLSPASQFSATDHSMTCLTLSRFMKHRLAGRLAAMHLNTDAIRPPMWNEPGPSELALLPPQYSSEHQNWKDTVIHALFFIGGCDWHAVKYDLKD